MILKYPLLFVLENKQPIPIEDSLKWGEWYSSIDNRIVKKEIINDKTVSTVFLGVDHNFRRLLEKEHTPIFFETMVFDNNDEDIYCERYATWEQAEEGHKIAVQWVLDGCNKNDN